MSKGLYRDGEQVAKELPEVTIERILEWMKNEDYSYELLEEESQGRQIRTGFEGTTFIIRIATDDDGDSSLYIRSVWAGETSLDDRDAVVDACNNWASQKYWPKAYCEEHNGGIHVWGESTWFLGRGVTDQQLGYLLDASIGTGVQLSKYCAEQLVDITPGREGE